MNNSTIIEINAKIEYQFKKLSYSPHTVSYFQVKSLLTDVYLLFRKWEDAIRVQVEASDEKRELLEEIIPINHQLRLLYKCFQTKNTSFQEERKLRAHALLCHLKQVYPSSYTKSNSV